MACSYPMYRTPQLIVDERVLIHAGKPFTAAEERQLDDEAGADDHAAELFDEALDRLDRPTCREHVVVDHDPGAVRDQLRVQLERVLAVLQHVTRADRLRRQLSRPA